MKKVEKLMSFSEFLQEYGDTIPYSEGYYAVSGSCITEEAWFYMDGGQWKKFSVEENHQKAGVASPGKELHTAAEPIKVQLAELDTQPAIFKRVVTVDNSFDGEYKKLEEVIVITDDYDFELIRRRVRDALKTANQGAILKCALDLGVKL